MAVLLFLSCGATEQPPYAVVVRNETPALISEAHVSYGELRSIRATLPAGASARRGVVVDPIPERATVQWQSENGEVHSKEVDVRAVVPDGFSGDIIFEIQSGDRVSVRSEARAPK